MRKYHHNNTQSPAAPKNLASFAQTKPGFYHANHLIIKITVQTTPQATACYPPKSPAIAMGCFLLASLLAKPSNGRAQVGRPTLE
jgi:hypothetical protein